MKHFETVLKINGHNQKFLIRGKSFFDCFDYIKGMLECSGLLSVSSVVSIKEW